MTDRVSIFTAWHFVIIIAWWGASALAAGVMVDADAPLALRIALTVIAFLAAISAPGLLSRRVERLDADQRQRFQVNMIAGGFWALSFNVAMAGYHLIIDGADGARTAVFFMIMGPPMALAFTAFITAYGEWVARRHADEDQP